MIDPQQLTAIASGAPELVLEILEDFRSDALEKLSRLSSSLTEQDFTTAEGLLHQLCGTSGTLGLTELYQTLKIHQQKCRARQELGEIIDPLTDLLNSSVTQARQHLEKQSPQ